MNTEGKPSQKRQRQKRLQLDSLRLEPLATTTLGAIITYMQQQPGTTARDLVVQLLRIHYLPFILDKTERNYQAIALDCATECERWGRMIREYAGLSLPNVVENRTENQAHPNTVNQQQKVDEDEELDEDEQQMIERNNAHHAALFGHL